MRSLFITAAAASVAIALAGCPYHRQQPVPGPQSSTTDALALSVAAHRDAVHGAKNAHAPGEIIWFQGTLEEAFTRRPCTRDHS